MAKSGKNVDRTQTEKGISGIGLREIV